jgi:phage terminase large subunit GpA-like protein
MTTGIVELGEVEQLYAKAAAAGMRPDPDLLVSEWADQFRMLTTRSSPEPGLWRTERTPFLRQIMDDLSPRSRWERVVFMKGHQLGATECGNNWTAFNIHRAPGPMMIVQPTTDMAKRNSKQRIGPLIEDCPALRELVRDPRSRDSGNTVLAKEYPGGILVLVGANSAKGLRSMPVRYLFLDEVDAYPENIDREGEPCELAIARTSNFGSRRKIFVASTPTVSGRSRIEKFFQTSDQCYYYVPCPFCAEMQVLRFEQMRWKKGHPEDAAYICVTCGKRIPNHAKNFMLPKGEWRPHAIGDGRTRGYHLSSLYSPAGWLSWEAIARQYDAAGTDAEKQQVFWNIVLGEPWSEQGEAPEFDRLYERRERYKMGTVPRGGLLLVAGVDVQKFRLEVEIVAYGKDRQSWSVDYRVFEGDTTQDAVWEKVLALVEEEFPSEHGGFMKLDRMGVDTGFNTTIAYNWIRRIGPKAIALKGDTKHSALIGQASPIEVGPAGRMKTFGLRLWPVNTNLAKEELYRWLRLSLPDLEKKEKYPSGFCHFPQYSKEYFEQLCGEKLITRIQRGQRKSRWEKIRDRNEALDCRIYARAAAASLRFEIWPEDEWANREYDLTPQRPTDGEPQRQVGKPPKFKSWDMGDPYLG